MHELTLRIFFILLGIWVVWVTWRVLWLSKLMRKLQDTTDEINTLIEGTKESSVNSMRSIAI